MSDMKYASKHFTSFLVHASHAEDWLISRSGSISLITTRARSNLTKWHDKYVYRSGHVCLAKEDICEPPSKQLMEAYSDLLEWFDGVEFDISVVVENV